MDSKELHVFIKLLTGHQTALRAFITSLIPGSPDVDDILQDTNIVLWEKMNNYEPNTNFCAWAFAIARNMVKAQLRKTKRNQSAALRDDIIQAIAETWYQQSPESSNKKQSALDFCLKSLSKSQRDLISARYSHSQSLMKYSEAVGRTTKSLSVSLFRIREKLRNCVKQRIALKGDAR